MANRHVKKGDEVVVIAGSARGSRGKVIEVLPGKERVIVEGLNMIKKHTRRSQQYPEGRIIEREGTIHLSNVMLAGKFDERASKRGGGAAAPAQE
jgi:large subunit ribosomal protein L24